MQPNPERYNLTFCNTMVLATESAWCPVYCRSEDNWIGDWQRYYCVGMHLLMHVVAWR